LGTVACRKKRRIEMKSYKVVVAAVAVAACFCSGLRAADEKRPAPLFERLGGMNAINAVVDDFVVRILADERVNRWFAHAASDPENARAYKSKLADFICQAAGGPCKYTGADMFAAHRGRGITEDAFNAVVSDLVATLAKLQVPEKEQGQLLGLLAPIKPAVVQPEK
jgi:hemoglobin